MHQSNHSKKKKKKSLVALLKLFEILDTTAVDCRKAVLSGVSNFEDAVMAETALRERVDCIVTRNLRDFRNAAIRVLEPAGLIAEIYRETV